MHTTPSLEVLLVKFWISEMMLPIRRSFVVDSWAHIIFQMAPPVLSLNPVHNALVCAQLKKRRSGVSSYSSQHTHTFGHWIHHCHNLLKVWSLFYRSFHKAIAIFELLQTQIPSTNKADGNIYICLMMRLSYLYQSKLLSSRIRILGTCWSSFFPYRCCPT